VRLRALVHDSPVLISMRRRCTLPSTFFRARNLASGRDSEQLRRMFEAGKCLIVRKLTFMSEVERLFAIGLRDHAPRVRTILAFRIDGCGVEHVLDTNLSWISKSCFSRVDFNTAENDIHTNRRKCKLEGRLTMSGPSPSKTKRRTAMRADASLPQR